MLSNEQMSFLWEEALDDFLEIGQTIESFLDGNLLFGIVDGYVSDGTDAINFVKLALVDGPSLFETADFGIEVTVFSPGILFFIKVVDEYLQGDAHAGAGGRNENVSLVLLLFLFGAQKKAFGTTDTIRDFALKLFCRFRHKCIVI